MRIGSIGRKWLVVGLLLTSGGCGGSPPERVVVRGQVSYQGNPLAGGLIVFTPDEEQGYYGAQAVATIDRDGSYRLHTDGTAGAAPGKYRVTIAAAPAKQGTPTRLDRYRHPQQSGLVREITREPENILDFQLGE